MRLFRRLSALIAFTAVVLLTAHASAPAPTPGRADPTVTIEFRSTPNGAQVVYKVTQDVGWNPKTWVRKIKETGASALGIDTDEVPTNAPKYFPLKHGLNIIATFKLAGHRDCEVKAKIKVDKGGRRLEIGDDKQQLYPNNASPAIIMCVLREE
jgi:hypothetical protein